MIPLGILAAIPRGSGGSSANDDYYQAVLADSPVAWWRLAELSGTNADNIGSSAIDGTYTGGYTLGRPSLCNGLGDASCGLNGSTGRIPAGAVSDFQYASNFTYEAIVKPTLFDAIRAIMSHGYLGPCLRITTAGKLNWLKSYSLDRGASTGALVAGQVAHVAVKVASDGVTTFFINGAASGTGTTASDYGSSTQIFKIGVDTDSGSGLSNFFLGDIDEVAIYNSALSDARILAHAQAAGLA